MVPAGDVTKPGPAGGITKTALAGGATKTLPAGGVSKRHQLAVSLLPFPLRGIVIPLRNEGVL